MRVVRSPLAGFSLAELLVASTLLSFLILGCLRVLDAELGDFHRKRLRAELTRDARQGLDLMSRELRRAGLDHDLDGRGSSSDEALEYMGRHAVLFRANQDGEELLGGREEDLETEGEELGRLVAIANEELIGFALGVGRDGEGAPTGELEAWLDLSEPRDAVRSTTGELLGEESLSLQGIRLQGAEAGHPPYTLHRLHLGPRGRLVREPMIDGVADLVFRYFDSSGAELAPTGGGPEPGPSSSARGADAPERATRARVASMRIELTMVARERDLRVQSMSPDRTGPLLAHRHLELTSRVSLPNTMRPTPPRTTGPAPVEDLRLCTGQCGFLRVSWRPGPAPPDAVSHVLRLHHCETEDELGAAWWTSEQIASSDLATTDEDDRSPRQALTLSAITPPDELSPEGTCIVVLARDASGRLSAPSTRRVHLVFQDEVRPEAASRGRGSGYSREASAWPFAPPDGVDGTPLAGLDTDDRPLPLRIEVRLQPPRYALPSPDPGSPHWTTATTGGHAALPDCWWLLDDERGLPRRRTPLAELAGAKGRPNTYVFRMSGSCPADDTPLLDPQGFLPGPATLHDFVSLDLTAHEILYVDDSLSSFAEPLDAGRPHVRRFLGTAGLGIRPAGRGAPPRALSPGEVYYYRFRFVDDCWRDADRNGIHDGTEGTSQVLAAWSRPGESLDDEAWQVLARSLSPFYPPLLAEGSSDEARQDANDSDAWQRDSGPVGLALPGRAIPAVLGDGRVVPPEAPNELQLLPISEEGVSAGAGVEQGLRLSFNSSKRTAPWQLVPSSTEPSMSVGIGWYRLVRRLVSLDLSTHPPRFPRMSELDFSSAWPGDEIVTEFRLSQSAGLAAYTIDENSEVQGGMASSKKNSALVLPVSGLPAGMTHAYSLIALQLSEEVSYRDGPEPQALPSHPTQDGVATGQVSASEGSSPFLFPCPLREGVRLIRVNPDRVEGGRSEGLRVRVERQLGASPSCQDLMAARVLAHSATSGDFLGSSSWTPLRGDERCEFTLPRHGVAAALRGFEESALLSVEISNDPSDRNREAEDTASGCRIRSGQTGPDTHRLPLACEQADCGTVNNPHILGSLLPSQVSVEGDGEVLVLRLENLCGRVSGRDFNLLQLEVVLDRPDGHPMPLFVEGALVGVAGGRQQLPSLLDHQGPDVEGERSQLRLRWHERSFCDPEGLNCSPPLVLAETAWVELRLRFDAPLCDRARFLAFNFRVPLPAGAGELLCSSRAAVDEAQPLAPGRTGAGRGPGVFAELLSCSAP